MKKMSQLSLIRTSTTSLHKASDAASIGEEEEQRLNIALKSRAQKSKTETRSVLQVMLDGCGQWMKMRCQLDSLCLIWAAHNIAWIR